MPKSRLPEAGNDDEEEDNGDTESDEVPSEAEIKAWKKERTQVNKQLKTKNANFETRLKESVNMLDENAAAELLLTILHDDMATILNRHIRAQRQRVIGAFETWWDKYRVTLTDIEAERDAAAAQLQEFLGELGYVT
jgi:type I restriction enzyme M protein